MSAPVNDPVNPANPVIGVGGFAAASILEFLQNISVMAQLQQEMGTALESQTTATINTMQNTMTQGQRQAKMARWQSWSQAIGSGAKALMGGIQSLRSAGIFNSGLKDLMNQASGVKSEMQNLMKYNPLLQSPAQTPAALVGEANALRNNPAVQASVERLSRGEFDPAGPKQILDVQGNPVLYTPAPTAQNPNPVQVPLTEDKLGSFMEPGDRNAIRTQFNDKTRELTQRENSLWTQINTSMTSEGQVFSLLTSAIDSGTQGAVGQVTKETQDIEALKNYLGGLNQVMTQILQQMSKAQDAANQAGEAANQAINALGR